MNALLWQDQVLIALAAFAVVGALALVIWIKIGTIEDVPRPGGSPFPGPGFTGVQPSNDGRGLFYAYHRGLLRGVWSRKLWAEQSVRRAELDSPSIWAEPSEEDTLTWLARVHEEKTPGRAPDGDPGSGPARPGGDRLDRLAAAFAADTIIDARIRDWLDELIEKGLDGYRTADEWVAARTRELAAVAGS